MSPEGDDFERSVFINCPFDPEYLPLRRALLFVVLDCGLEPRIALQRFDSGEARMEKIRNLIRMCRFSIHDISRMEPLKSGRLPRFNMPFELGLDLGCRYYGGGVLSTKQCLVLERKLSRYRRVLSDLAGHDISAHQNDPETLVTEVRNWLATLKPNLRSGSRIWQRFNIFYSYLEPALASRHYTKKEIEDLPAGEYIEAVKQWQAKERAEERPGAN